jgi:hypothetical protein
MIGGVPRDTEEGLELADQALGWEQPKSVGELIAIYRRKGMRKEEAVLLTAERLRRGGAEIDEDKIRAAVETVWHPTPGGTPREIPREAERELPLPTVPELAREPDILGLFADEVAAAGLAGERRLAKLIYLAVTSRLLDRVVSLAVKGPSSAGKSFVVECVLAYVPPAAYYALSAMSEHAIVYDQEPLKHRILVIYEAAGLAGDLATYMVRSLLSEGRVRYVTVEKVKGGGLQPKLIDREGPTGLIVTTTEVKLHPENETRLLSLTVTDSAEQTKAVLLAQAGELRRPDPGQWHELQDWLAKQSNRVSVPYASELAQLIPPVAVRLRRDFPAVLALVRAHAVLHQANRRRDSDGRIVASVEDYGAVRGLVADLVAEAAERTVPDTTRETVAAVAELVAGRDSTTITAVAGALRLDKSAAWRRARVAMERGYLRNLEEKRGRPARLVLGDALPEELVVLPDPARLQGCNAVPGDTHTHQAQKTNGLQPELGVPFPIPRNESATVQPPTRGALKPEVDAPHRAAETEDELLEQLRFDSSRPVTR